MFVLTVTVYRVLRRVRKLAKSEYQLLHVSMRLSVRMEQLGSCWTDFLEIWYSCIFRKFIDKFQVTLKYDNNNGYFT